MDYSDTETDYDSDQGSFDQGEPFFSRDPSREPITAQEIGEGDEWVLDMLDPSFLQVQNVMGVPKIRELQAKVLSLLKKKHCVLLLARTGWGKSLIFQGLYYMDLDPKNSTQYITVVFVPLTGLGQEQVGEINRRGRAHGEKDDVAIFYDKTKVADHHLEDIRKGKYRWIYLSPEKALHPDVFNKVWESPDFRSKVLLIAVDEAHLVSEWCVNTLAFSSSS